MGAEPYDAAANQRPTNGVVRDAMWRRDGVAVIARPVRGHTAPDAGGPPDRRDGPPINPWSREAVEAPLPTVDEIRERWRAELGLDEAPARSPDPLVRPRRDDDAPSSTATGDLVLGGVVVALLLVIACGAAWALRPTTTDNDVTATDRLPVATDDTRWSIELDEPLRSFVVDDGVVAMMQADELLVVDAETGDVRWTVTPPGPIPEWRIGVYDGVVMVIGARTTDLALAAYDAASGELLWQRSDPLVATYAFTPEAPVEFDGSGDGPAIARVIDAATGSPVGAGVAALPSLSWPAGFVVGNVGPDLTLLDIEAGEVVAPAVPEFGLRSIAAVGDHIVGLTDESEIVVFDDDGVAVDRRPFVSDAFGDFNGRAQLVGGVPGTSIGIVASGTSVGFEVVDGRIEQRWGVDGRITGPIVETDIGPLAVGRLVDAESGVVQIVVVDVVDGTIVATTNADGDREGEPLLLADGYVLHPTIGDPDRVVTAFRYDGSEAWSRPLGPPPAAWTVGDGSLFVIDDVGITASR